MKNWAVIGEILADARMKSAKADEIFGVASDEIKSTLPPSRRISSPQGISSSKTISSTRKGGFNCKRPDAKHLVFCWWGRTDSNHRSETQQIYSLSPLATRELPHILFSSSVEPVDGLV